MQWLSEEKLPELLEDLKSCLDAGATPIAAFDADGTLWNTDIGEVYFEYIIKNKLVELPEDPWAHYLGLRNGDFPPAGYLWLAQIMKEVPLEEAQRWSDAIVEENSPLPLFDAQQKIISSLKGWGVEIFIVTASVKWAVEGAAKLYGIDADHVVGVTTRVESGKITATQDGPVTWKEGKVEGLLNFTNNKAPFFSAGNSSGDIYLLNCATHRRLAVRTVAENDRIFASEEELHQIAQKNSWWTHDFRKN